MSTFAWLDYSEAERRRMLDVITLFKEQETRDELGIGVIRDAFSDLFFPGTSTIQTRARYFLFIPWIFLQLEKRHTSSSKIARKARHEEVRLIRALKASGIEEGKGVIGYRAEDALQRMPSTIYWQGLLKWGLRLFPDSMGAYYRSLDGHYRRRRTIQAEYQQDGWRERLPHNWHPGLEDLIPDDFPDGVTFALTAEESVYLRERIIASQPNTLLAWLAARGESWSETRFPWQHPAAGALPDKLQTQLNHARNFSELIEGAPLLYNLMLAEKAASAERIDLYREALAEWAAEITRRQSVYKQWDWRHAFWQQVLAVNPRLSRRAQTFVSNWLERALAAPNTIADDDASRNLILLRERQLKRKLSRLENPRALELWSGAAGVGQLDFRWRSAQNLLADILAGGQDHA